MVLSLLFCAGETLGIFRPHERRLRPLLDYHHLIFCCCNKYAGLPDGPKFQKSTAVLLCGIFDPHRNNDSQGLAHDLLTVSLWLPPTVSPLSSLKTLAHHGEYYHTNEAPSPPVTSSRRYKRKPQRTATAGAVLTSATAPQPRETAAAAATTTAKPTAAK